MSIYIKSLGIFTATTFAWLAASGPALQASFYDYVYGTNGCSLEVWAYEPSGGFTDGDQVKCDNAQVHASVTLPVAPDFADISVTYSAENNPGSGGDFDWASRTRYTETIAETFMFSDLTPAPNSTHYLGLGFRRHGCTGSFYVDASMWAMPMRFGSSWNAEIARGYIGSYDLMGDTHHSSSCTLN